MSKTQSTPDTSSQPTPSPSLLQRRPARLVVALFIAAALVTGWVLLNNNASSTDPTPL